MQDEKNPKRYPRKVVFGLSSVLLILVALVSTWGVLFLNSPNQADAAAKDCPKPSPSRDWAGCVEGSVKFTLKSNRQNVVHVKLDLTLHAPKPAGVPALFSISSSDGNYQIYYDTPADKQGYLKPLSANYKGWYTQEFDLQIDKKPQVGPDGYIVIPQSEPYWLFEVLVGDPNNGTGLYGAGMAYVLVDRVVKSGNGVVVQYATASNFSNSRWSVLPR